MRYLIILCCFFTGAALWAQDHLVNVFEYETSRWPQMVSQPIKNKITIYQRGAESFEFLQDPYDKSIVPRPKFRITIPQPYGAFYFNEDTGNAVWVRMLEEGDTIRAELNFKPERWTLLPDTATIDGFFCRHAERYFASDYLVRAWYTEDLGIHAMPKDYWGLPGVLVKSNQFDTMRLSAVRLGGATVKDLKPASGKLLSLDKLRASKSRAEKLMDIMPMNADE